jgi:hypothetical protein
MAIEDPTTADVRLADAKTASPKAADEKEVPAPKPPRSEPSGSVRARAFSDAVVEPPFVPKRTVKALKAEALSRRDPDAIRRAFETGDYPYKTKVTEKAYLERMLPLQTELLKAQNWIKQTGEKIVMLFEGRDAAGKGGTIKRFMEHLNPRGAHRRAGQAERARALAMVFPALYRAPALRRGNRLPRPLLVQPRGRRARHGLLHAQRISRIHAPVPRPRAHVRAHGRTAL